MNQQRFLFLLTVMATMTIMTVGEEITVPEQQEEGQEQPVCFPKLQNPPASMNQTVWTVGVLVIRGMESAYAEFNSTFNSYLSLAAGQRFQTPLQFQMKPIGFLDVFDNVQNGDIDFIYSNPSLYSCMESEHRSRSLVTQISLRRVGGVDYSLKRFGGVMIARADRDDINTISDLEGHSVAAVSISGLGSGQMQFREMQSAGMNYLNDPSQVIFTFNQAKIVHGVSSNEFDVGFIRTDQLERTPDPEDPDRLVDPDRFKIINAQPGLEIDGVPFPFVSSTPLYPEWNLAALTHVPDPIAGAVQFAMLSLQEHASATTNAARCDTTDEVAAAARTAMDDGNYAGWAVSSSYMELRNMQETTGFIRLEEEDNVWRCVRGAELYDAITCPRGWKKKSKEQVENGCEEANLVCQEGYRCICKPCYVPLECIDSVEVFGRCVEYEILLPAILLPIGILSLAACLTILAYKSRQMVRQAETAAKNERDLNEFIAHEVRNPLAAAISASVFVNSAVQAEISEETRDALQEDAGIISSSLKFINDLLRSMLDIHRATKDQMVLEKENVDLQHDIFEPVSSMVYNRDTSWTVLIKCPEGLVIKSDKLRLQQVVLNLARNAAKFVEEGFVRLRADIIDNSVHIFIEDSGPGIPEQKKKNLFNRYQQSLDSMAQGTGVGLNLCQKLVSLMDGTIQLKDDYRSGFRDYPGACIDIDLNQEPQLDGELTIVEWDAKLSSSSNGSRLPSSIRNIEQAEGDSLPRGISVLFVDDDRNLRKLAIRSLRKACPDWYIREAASGETALTICESEFFDIIFMDQYMTSVEQCLKGTETTRALRSRGVKSIICGLSANNLKKGFKSAGADDFQVKPFPVHEKELHRLLKRLIAKRIKIQPISEVKIPGSLVVPEADDEVSALGDFSTSKATRSTQEEKAPEEKLHETLANGLDAAISILFVDDDRILRRLGARAMRNLMPNCYVRESDNGESAVRLCEVEGFDLVFIDQHMAGTGAVETTMTGAETVAAMRSQGIDSVITGLSANDNSAPAFFAAGADNFQLKPFPCARKELKPLLLRLLSILDQKKGESGTTNITANPTTSIDEII